MRAILHAKANLHRVSTPEIATHNVARRCTVLTNKQLHYLSARLHLRLVPFHHKHFTISEYNKLTEKFIFSFCENESKLK